MKHMGRPAAIFILAALALAVLAPAAAADVCPPQGRILSVAPGSVYRGQQVDVDIIGEGTSWVQDATSVYFMHTSGEYYRIWVAYVKVLSPTHMVCNIHVDQTAPALGEYDVSASVG